MKNRIRIPAKRKAFVVYPEPSPDELGCLLIYAYSRNDARNIGCQSNEWEDELYRDITASRKAYGKSIKHYDKYAGKIEGSIVGTNDDLPDGAPGFYVYDDE